MRFLKVIDPEDRVTWDIFVFIIILISAFEIPYSIVINWENKDISLFFDILFYSVFSVDLTLNLMTKRKKSYTGYLGWRYLVGILRYKLSVEYQKNNPSKNDKEEFDQFSEIAKDYITSGWFIIDIMSIIPFELFFSSFGFLNASRLAKLSRLPHLIRFSRSIRIIKLATAYKKHKDVSQYSPSLTRFIALLVFLPWIIHISACLYVLDNPHLDSSFESYMYAFSISFSALKTAKIIGSNTALGWGLNILIVTSGLFFYGAFIANFNSILRELDQDNLEFENRVRKCKQMFRKYPSIFNKKLQRRVLDSIRNHHYHKDILSDDSEFLLTLEHDVRTTILTKLAQNEHEIQLKTN